MSSNSDATKDPELVFRGQMAGTLLSGIKGVDLRTALQLQAAGLMPVTSELEVSVHARESLDRTDQVRAPLLTYLNPATNVTHIVPTLDMLGSPDARTRTTALDVLVNTGAQLEPPFLPTTLRTLRDARPTLATDAAWETSAVAAIDALDDDWHYHFGALRQCVANEWDDALPEHLDRVLYPSTSAIALLVRDLALSSMTPEALQHTIDAIAQQSPTGLEAIGRYVDVLGHLPLRDEFSASAMLKAWMSTHKADAPTFDALRQLASTVASPLALYHVCRIAVEVPGVIRESDAAPLWEAILAVTRWWIAPEKPPASAPRWELRSQLTAHFLRHLECFAPMSTVSENVCFTALLMAERVARLFDDESVLDWAVGDVAKPAVQRSGFVWSIGRPMSTRSLVRFAALNPRLLWTT